jgi:hypothetical protein
MLITQHYFMLAIYVFLTILLLFACTLPLTFFNVDAAEESVDPRVAHFVAVHGLDTADDDHEIDEYNAASAAAYASYMDNASADNASADDDSDDDEQPDSPEPEPAEVNGECLLFAIMLN